MIKRLPRDQQITFKPPKFIWKRKTESALAVAFNGLSWVRQRVEDAGLFQVVVAERGG
jgi:hypothetical protein